MYCPTLGWYIVYIFVLAIIVSILEGVANELNLGTTVMKLIGFGGFLAWLFLTGLFILGFEGPCDKSSLKEQLFPGSIASESVEGVPA